MPTIRETGRRLADHVRATLAPTLDAAHGGRRTCNGYHAAPTKHGTPRAKAETGKDAMSKEEYRETVARLFRERYPEEPDTGNDPETPADPDGNALAIDGLDPLALDIGSAMNAAGIQGDRQRAAMVKALDAWAHATARDQAGE